MFPIGNIFYFISMYNHIEGDITMTKFRTFNAEKIAAIKWEDNNLIVEMHSGIVYQYKDVELEVFNKLKESNLETKQMDEVFEELISGRYNFIEI